MSALLTSQRNNKPNNRNCIVYTMTCLDLLVLAVSCRWWKMILKNKQTKIHTNKNTAVCHQDEAELLNVRAGQFFSTPSYIW